MEVTIIFKKPDGTEIPLEEMTTEERKIQAQELTKRFAESLGYEAKNKTA